MIAASIALLLTIATAAAVWHDNTALAKNQAKSPAVNAKEIMAKFSPPKSKTESATSEPVRRSRLKEMNIVGEAAQALNVMPITIIDEMKKGKTLEQVAKAKGLTKKQFLQKLTNVENKMIDTAVKDKTITKEHAEAIKAGQKERLEHGLMQTAVDVNDHQAMDMGN